MAKKPILGVLQSSYSWDLSSSLPFAKDEDRKGYARFFSLAQEYNFSPIALLEEDYTNGSYTKGWQWNGTEWHRVKGPISPTIIFDKTKFTYHGITERMESEAHFITVNPWEMNIVASDKLFSGIAFSHITPKTVMIHNRQQLSRALDQITTDKVVLKPRLGIGGEGIRILPRKKAYGVRSIENMILQEFIDTKKGIADTYVGIHDFRVIIAGDTPVFSYIRTPAPGTELCNISQGGGVIDVPLKSMPTTLRPLLKTIYEALSLFPYKFYSADFLFKNTKTPLLIELNTKPILVFPPEYQKQEERMHQLYLKYFQGLV